MGLRIINRMFSDLLQDRVVRWPKMTMTKKPGQQNNPRPGGRNQTRKKTPEMEINIERKEGIKGIQVHFSSKAKMANRPPASLQSTNHNSAKATEPTRYRQAEYVQ